jgi:hypothetical protein
MIDSFGIDDDETEKQNKTQIRHRKQCIVDTRRFIFYFFNNNVPIPLLR